MLRLLSNSITDSNSVHSGRQRVTETHLDALLYQMEAGAIALVGGQVKTEESVAVPEVAARQSVPLVLPHLNGRGEQVHVAPDEEVVVEIRLERFEGYLSVVHVHCEEVDVVVLGVQLSDLRALQTRGVAMLLLLDEKEWPSPDVCTISWQR